MENKKNTPPAGVLVALGIIAAVIIFYFILTTMFPDLFRGLSQGKIAPAK